MAGQLCEVDKVGSFLRTGARFGKLREQVTTEEAVECEDGDAKAAAGDGKKVKKEPERKPALNEAVASKLAAKGVARCKHCAKKSD